MLVVENIIFEVLLLDLLTQSDQQSKTLMVFKSELYKSEKCKLIIKLVGVLAW